MKSGLLFFLLVRILFLRPSGLPEQKTKKERKNHFHLQNVCVCVCARRHVSCNIFYFTGQADAGAGAILKVFNFLRNDNSTTRTFKENG